MKTAALRRAWIVRYLLLWTMGTRTRRIDARDHLGIVMAYELQGYEPHLLAGDLATLHREGLLHRHKGNSRGLVYWLQDPAAAKEWVKQWPEPELFTEDETI